MKKGMIPCPSQDGKNQQTPAKEDSKQASKRSERNSVQKEQSKDGAVDVEKSKRSSRKSIRESSKDKSYHKSRIQQSIKDNIELQQNQGDLNYAVAATTAEPEKSMKSHHNTNRSEVKKDSSSHEVPQPAEIDESKKSERRSERRSSRKSVNQSGQKVELAEPSPSVRTPSVHQSSKKEASVKQSSKVGYPDLENASESREYEVNINAVNSFHRSKVEPQSDKSESRIDELKSQK